MLNKKLIGFLILGMAVFIALQSGCKTGGDTVENPVPVIDAISPWARAAHMPSFTLTVTGSDFKPGARINFNGIARDTQFNSATELTCTIETADLHTGLHTGLSPKAAKAGTSGQKAEGTAYAVTVTNPAPGGGESDHKLFTVVEDLSFTAPVTVLFGTNKYNQPGIATDSAGTIAIILRLIPANNSGDSIMTIFSADGGVNFDNPVFVYQSQGQCHNPGVVVDSQGTLNVVFFAENQLLFSRSTDSFFNWTTPTALSNPVILADEIIDPAIFLDNNDTIYVAWTQQERGGNMAVFFSRSADNGGSWTSPVNVFTGWTASTSAHSARITADNNNGVYVTWTASADLNSSNHVFVNTSTDSGDNWGASATRFADSSSPDIAVHPDGTLYLALSVQYGPGSSDVFLYASADRGINWNGGTAITNNLNGETPGLAIDAAGNIDILYRENPVLIFTRSTDNGLTWSNPMEVTRIINPVQMTADPFGNLVFVYSDADEHGLSFLTNSRYF